MDTLEDLQSEVVDTSQTVGNIQCALTNAESCESVEDFHGNILDAIDAAREALKELLLLESVSRELMRTEEP